MGVIIMSSTFKKFYLFACAGIILASYYPIYMGVVTVTDYIKNGSIDVADYQKYIIPYTPISISLIITVVLMPVIFKLFKRHGLLIASFLGLGLFFASETFFENMIVMEGMTKADIESWQVLSCVATPEVWRTMGNPLVKQYRPAFKIHFYIISVVIILTVLNVIYGFSRMIRENSYEKRRPLIVQAISSAVFIGLCIFACFTAFFRNGTINISPLSASLMSVFFIVFGVTAGVYAGSFYFGRKTFLSAVVPALVSILTTIVMYVGELVLTGGVLFKFGSGFLFEPLGMIPFAVIDIVVILFSGVLTYSIMNALAKSQNSISHLQL